MVAMRVQSLIRLTVVLGLVVPSTSWAQAAKAKKAPLAGVEVEEITVTAQKREESIDLEDRERVEVLRGRCARVQVSEHT
jgi:hypothetical protein